MDVHQILRVSQNADKTELQSKYSRMYDTYQMVVSFAEDPDVIRIARTKLEQLILAGQQFELEPERIESSPIISIQHDISSIRLALNSSRANPTTLRANGISGKIDKLPDSAEKHYLKAVVALKLDSTFGGCKAAIDEIQRAVELDSSNAAYIGLLDAIGEQLNYYKEKQCNIAEAMEHDRIEQERRSQEVLNAAQRRRFRDSAGGCLGGLAGIGAVVGACICCASTCRDDCC